nr:HD domain-containing phosphohydrolase [Vibrio intestinalis]
MFVFCTLFTAGVALVIQYHFATKNELNHTLTRYQVIANGVSSHLSNLHTLAENITKGGAQLVQIIGTDVAEKRLVVPLSKLLTRDPSLHSIYVAKENNEFFQLINLESEQIKQTLKTERGERWLLVEHKGEGKQRRKVSTFYDRNFNQLDQEEQFSNFLPTQRSWYENAIQGRVYYTPPYLFNTLKVTGETFSIKVEGSETVVGVDVLLSSLESQLTNRFVENKHEPQAEAFIYRADGRLIATNKKIDIEDRLPLVSSLPLTDRQIEIITNAPELKVSNQNDWGPIDFTVGGRPNGFAIDIFKVISEMTGLQFKYVNGRSWNELVNDFSQGKIDILQSFSDPSEFESMGVLGERLYRGNYALLMNESSDPVTSLNQLSGRKIGVLKGWSIQDNIQQQFPSISLVSYDSLHAAIDDLEAGNIEAVLDLHRVLMNKVQEKFRESLTVHALESTNLPRNFYYSVRDEYSEVVEIINLALANITESQRQELREKWFSSGAAQSTYTFLPYREIVKYTSMNQYIDAVQEITINGEQKYLFIKRLTDIEPRFFAVIVPKAYVMAGVKEVTWYSVGASLLALAALIPFAWVMARPISEPINLLRQQVKLVKKRRYSEVQRVHSRVEEIHQLGLSVIRSSHSFERFEQQQNEFFESVIQLIARAIDEKSPYTAGHCHRVPEIALMLAEAAENTEDGQFKHFRFENDEERREFRIAAWLHDCGKIATPEYVVDKGSKLETNYNRIHEVRMRFEVLWRDAQIKHLLGKLDNQVDLDSELQQELEQLREEFGFIANANVGGEFMSEQDIERLHLLAEKEWTRYFDRGLGLSPLEETRHQPENTPATEKLLSDRDEHVIDRHGSYDLDPELGIKVDIPEKLYNHGEIYNLSVQRGTLSAEERFKINEHMISGIRMLESIPFPPELARVARYATTHHETMVGNGYPRRLKGEDLSIPERILVVADIFEALTAADRPYKKAKSLREAISIMSKMVQGGHIDKQVFQLLLSSGVYRSYAEKYLPEELLDLEDVEPYLKES